MTTPCPIGLDDSPSVCSAGTCDGELCTAHRKLLGEQQRSLQLGRMTAGLLLAEVEYQSAWAKWKW